ncbi:MAG TPA: hypothetical protein VFO36_07405, partial [Nitrospiraceae bacterium]|nr:hypothetical protein [Nitrospiraceae bacterium]
GTAGPYMLDVGISSTREMAGFWGLGDADGTRGSVRTRPARPTINVSSSDSLRGDGQTAETARSDGELSQGGAVKKVIEDALRAAGLMR